MNNQELVEQVATVLSSFDKESEPYDFIPDAEAILAISPIARTLQIAQRYEEARRVEMWGGQPLRESAWPWDGTYRLVPELSTDSVESLTADSTEQREEDIPPRHDLRTFQEEN